MRASTWTLLLTGALLTTSPALARNRTERPVTHTADHKNAPTPIEVVKKMIAMWDTRNGDGIADMFTEDGVLHSMMIEPIVGREAIRPRMKFLVDNATQMKINVRTWATSGNIVFIERTDEFTFKGHSGKVPVVGVLVVEGDKVKEWREYYDRAELLKAMGMKQGF